MLLTMELRQLRYFVAVAETGNISQAAKKIFLTQPALSRQIKALEDEMGTCLLERQAHSIRLTAAGQRLLPEARDLLEHADQVLERVKNTGQALRMRVGYAPSLAAGILSPAVECFAQAHPNARVELLDLSTSEMVTGLESGQLDVALCVGQQRKSPQLKWTSLAKVTWQVAVSRNHRFAQQTRLTPLEAARESLLIYNQREYPEYWELVSAWLRQHRQRPTIAGEFDGAENLMAAVEAGLGIAIVASQMARLFPNRARMIPLASPPKPISIVVGCRTDRAGDKPLAVFVEELRKAAATV